MDEKTTKIVPICDGAFHLENSITEYKCYVCGAIETDEMVLLRADDNKFKFACLDHPGIVQEFVKQFKRAPLGWVYRKGDEDGRSDKDTSPEHTG